MFMKSLASYYKATDLHMPFLTKYHHVYKATSPLIAMMAGEFLTDELLFSTELFNSARS